MSDISLSENESSRGCSPEIMDQTPPSSAISSRTHRRQLFSEQLQILEELKKATSSIGTLANRIDAMENQLKSVEQQQTEFLLPTSSVSGTKKKSSFNQSSSKSFNEVNVTRYRKIRHNAGDINFYFCLLIDSLMPEDEVLQV